MTNLCSTLQTLHRNLLSDSESEIDDVFMAKLRSPIIAEHRRRHESSSSDGKSSTDRMFIPKTRDRFRSSSCDTRQHPGRPEYIHCRCCGLLKKAKVSFSDGVGDDDTPEEKGNPRIPNGCETKSIPRRSGSCDPGNRNRDQFQAVVKPGQTVSDTEFLARRQPPTLPRYEDVVSDGDRRSRGRQQIRHTGRPPPAPQSSSQRRQKTNTSYRPRQHESSVTVADVMSHVIQEENKPRARTQQYPDLHSPPIVVPGSTPGHKHGEQESLDHSPCWTQDQSVSETNDANDTDIPIELMPSFIPEERPRSRIPEERPWSRIPEERSRSRRRPNECDPAKRRSHIERGVSFKIAVDNQDRPKDVVLEQSRNYASEGSQWWLKPPHKPDFTSEHSSNLTRTVREHSSNLTRTVREHTSNLTRTVREHSPMPSGSPHRSMQRQTTPQHPNSVCSSGGKMKEHYHQRTSSPAAASRLTENFMNTPSSDYNVETNTAPSAHRTNSSHLAPPHTTAFDVCQEVGHSEEQSSPKTSSTNRSHFQRTSSPIRAHPCPVEPIAGVRNEQTKLPQTSISEHRPRTSSLSTPSRPSHLTIRKSSYEQSFHPETSSTPLCSRPPKPPPKVSPDKPPARPPKPLKLQLLSLDTSPDGTSSTNDAAECSDEPPALPPRGRPPRQPVDKPPERPPKSWVMAVPREGANPPPLPPRTRRSQSADSVFRKREAPPMTADQRRTASEGESQKLIMEVLV